mgnify:CR=1 FL=1
MSSKDKPKKTASTLKKIFVSPPGTIKFNKSSAHKSVPIKDPGFSPKKAPTILTRATKSTLRKKSPNPTKGGNTRKNKKKRTKYSILKKTLKNLIK